LIRVFIGFDSREAVAFSVLSHSIQARASAPVSVSPLMLSQLKGILTRERHPLQSTDFSFSRFLTPHLSGYEGWSVFMDCDMLMLDDIVRLYSLRDDSRAVMVVKHDHVPKETTKFLGEPQSKYEKKNWSSVMLFNNAKCRALTPGYVNAASGPMMISSAGCRTAGTISWATARRARMPRSCITRWAARTSMATGIASIRKNGSPSAMRCCA
jgi:hypothetical protein